MMRGIVAGAIVLCAMPVHAELAELAAARASVEQSDYPGAKAQLSAALLAGKSGPEELVEIYKLSGIVAGALGDAPAATAAFTKMLALAPKAGLPPGTSPKIAKPFASATAYFTSHAPLTARSETANEPPTVTLVATSDPLEMIAKVRVRFVVDGGAEQSREGAAGVPIPLPAGARIDLRLAALDTAGNRVVELGTKDVPIVIVGKGAGAITPPPPSTTPAKSLTIEGTTSEPTSDRPLVLAWWLHGVVGIAFAGAGTYFGLSARTRADELAAIEADSTNHTLAEARAAEDRARRDVLVTNIAFAAAGVFALSSAILFLTRPTSASTVRIEPRGTEGATLSWEVHW